MNHLPFVAGAYALGTLIPIVYGVMAFARAGAAKRRLAAVETRR